jgi:hypothetical protein
MRHRLLTNIGGLIWWLFIKFGKTDLDIELAKENWSRNLFIFLIIIILLGFISVKLQ